MQALDTIDKIVIVLSFIYILYLIHDTLTVKN